LVTYPSLSDGEVVQVVMVGAVVSMVKSPWQYVSSVASDDVGRFFVGTIEAEAMLGRGGSLPEAVAEPALGLAVVQDTVKGVAFCGIRRGQVAEVGRGGVCFEAEAGLGRGVVSSRGPDHASL
jgi:hypothetical protein